jgi:hypothetical protein
MAIPPTTTPPRLPNPPRTAAAKPRSIVLNPRSTVRLPSGAMRMPASAASADAMPKASIDIMLTGTP